ncbi:MAG TPA: hypothetical protein VK631_14080 [Solirubrobacteraceae bacterium]|nr:hypothetical protein [Solirubrobacteraceae bacterium]
MTRTGDDAVAAGRLRKANQFLEAAENIGDLADEEAEVSDAVVTLLVHAGIAAADVICCKALGQFAIGSDSHTEAAKLLGKVRQPDGKELAKRLSQLLGVKTKAGYTHRSVTAEERKRALRSAEQLVAAARAM